MARECPTDARGKMVETTIAKEDKRQDGKTMAKNKIEDKYDDTYKGQRIKHRRSLRQKVLGLWHGKAIAAVNSDEDDDEDEITFDILSLFSSSHSTYLHEN